MDLTELITHAATACGDQVKLGQRLGVKPQRITEWKHGHRPCPLHVQAQLAALAGQDPKEWVWKVVSAQMGRAVVAALLALGLAAANVAPDAAGPGRLIRRP